LINETLLGKEHIATIVTYDKIGAVYRELADYHKALSYFKQTLYVKEKILGTEHKATAYGYNDIGSIYDMLGNYSKALEYYSKSQIIYVKIFGWEHPATAAGFNNIGQIHHILGEYPDALENFSSSLAIKEKTLGLEHPSTAATYENFGLVYRSLADNNKALDYFLKALKIREKVLGKEHPLTASTYNETGFTYQNLEKYNEALSYYKKSLAINEKVLGQKHPDTNSVYNNIGLLLVIFGEHSQALKYFNKVRVNSEYALGKEHPDTAAAYNNIGLAHYNLGDYNEALKYFLDSLAVYENLFGKEHPKTANNYENIYTTYKALGQYDQYQLYAQKAFTAYIKHRKVAFGALSRVQKLEYMLQNTSKLYALLNSGVLHGDVLRQQESSKDYDSHKQQVADLWLSYKGSISSLENSIQLLDFQNKNPNTKDLIKELSASKRELIQMYQIQPDRGKSKAWQKQLAEMNKLESRIDTLEKKLAKEFDGYALELELELDKVNVREITLLLNDKTLYLDYAKADGNYFLFSINHRAEVELYPLDSKASDIDKSIKDLRSTLLFQKSNNSEQAEDKLKRELASVRRMLLHPLNDLLPQYNFLLISPDGALNTLPFEILYDIDKKKHLIEQTKISCIPSGRELVRIQQNQDLALSQSITVFADPVFSATDLQSQRGIQRVRKDNNPQRREADNFFMDHMKDISFNNLPGTAKEAIEITQLFPKDSVNSYIQENANEKKLFEIEAPKILHIATHGYFLSNKPISNPLLKVGIALNGANESIKNGQGEGIVTGFEIATMNLKGTDMVVLSACETGLGEVDDGEGVSGLGQAFIRAGAKKVIMSLWKVPDDETSQLMQEFYKNLNSSNYDDALRLAKLSLIHKGLSPYYWGGFIMNGYK